MRRLALLLCAFLGCRLGGTADRTARDVAVGHAATDGASVEVEDGLAAIQTLEAGKLVLWCGAPSIFFAVTLDEPAIWTLTVRNVMPGASFRASTEAGDLLGLDALDRPLPTRIEGKVALPAGKTRFRLVPRDADVAEPFRFAVLSDVQEALPHVDDLYARMREDPSLRFVFSAGDLTSSGARTQLEEYQRRLEALPIPHYGTLGNHETFTQGVPYYDYFGRGNFHFDFKGVHFTLLDSSDATLDPGIDGWVSGWLAHGRDGLHLVAMHVPPFDPSGTRSGAFVSRAEAAAILERFAEAGVDVTIYGHVHSFYAFDNAGIPAFISGGGGAIPERFDGIGRHFLKVDADPATQRADVAVVRVDP